MKLFLIYNNINNFTTTQNFEPNFTRRSTSQNNQQHYQQRESEIQICQQLKCEVQKNPAVGLDHSRSAMGLVSWWWLLGARSECKTERNLATCFESEFGFLLLWLSISNAEPSAKPLIFSTSLLLCFFRLLYSAFGFLSRMGFS